MLISPILAGYSVVDLMALNPGTQIVFIVAMYISVYPVAISMRNSNVYQVKLHKSPILMLSFKNPGIISNLGKSFRYLQRTR